MIKTEMNDSSRKYTLTAALLLSLFSALGTAFILFAYYAGTDDILSLRELVILASGSVLTAGCVFSLSWKQPLRILLLEAVCAVLLSAAYNFEFPELMRLPFQLPAENTVTITEIENGASLSMTWAYRFRPRTRDGDPFETDPDRDIPFSQLIRSENWSEGTIGEDPALTARETGSQIGIPQKFRTGLAVLCFRADNGTAILKNSGRDEPVVISAEMTAEQPYRIILQNGLLPEKAGNLIQILLWSGGFILLMACGISLCRLITGCHILRKNSVIFLCAFLIPCLFLLILCFFLKICPFGEKSFLINDMWGEYADYMAYFRSILSGENNLLYSFSKSIGDDFLSLMAFYVINPLNWLVCLFKPEDLPICVTILVILRYGICGLTASVYFVKRRKCGFSALLFSTCYALMSFNFVNAENTNLREGTLLLPLVILGIEQLIDNRDYRTYVWSLSALIFLNYYTGYQVCIFSFLYFIFFFFHDHRNESFSGSLFIFLKASALSVCISAFLLIPIVFQLRNGPKSFNASEFSFMINTPWKGFFGKLLTSAFDTEQISNGFPNLYTGLISILLFPLYFTNLGISRRNKIVTAGLLLAAVLTLQINPLNLALHGFTAPLWWPYRYSFIICFFIIIIAQESFSHSEGWRLSGLFISLILLTVLICLLSVEGYSWLTHNSLRVNISLLISLLFILYVFIQYDLPDSVLIICILTVMELFINSYHILSINTAYERSNTITDYITYFTENKPIFDRIRNEDDGFYRIEKTYARTPNDPLLFTYNGITHYSSTLNKDLMDFLHKSGFRIQPPYRINYWDGSDVTADSLLGIKYLISWNELVKPYETVFSEGQHTVFKNPYALPVMFTADASALNEKFTEADEGFEFQNRIFSALLGERTNIFIPTETKPLEISGMIPEDKPAETCYISEGNDDAALTWQITIGNSDTLYAFFPAEDIYPVRMTLNGKRSGYYFDSSSYHILRLGTYRSKKPLILEMMPEEDQICFRDAQFYHEDLSALKRAVSILSRDETDIKKVSSSHLTGSFTAPPGKVLFFTIPYDSGWTIRIDGRKVPVYRAFDTFMAVIAPEGTHTVDMRYIPVGLIPGAIISLITVFITVFSRKKRTSLPTDKTEKSA